MIAMASIMTYINRLYDLLQVKSTRPIPKEITDFTMAKKLSSQPAPTVLKNYFPVNSGLRFSTNA